MGGWYYIQAGARRVHPAQQSAAMRRLAALVPRAVRHRTALGSPVARSWAFPDAIIGTLLIFAGGLALVGYDALLSRLHAADISLVSLLVVFAAATCSSVAGFAFSALCGAVLFRTLNTPVTAVEIMLVCSVAIQSLSVLALRNEIDWRSLLQFVVGGVIGLPIGICALLNLPKGAYGSVFGALLIAYGGFMALHPPLRLRADAGGWNIVVGAVGGITGGLAAFPGAFVTIWCGLKGWNKSRQRGVYQPFILVMQILTIAALAMTPMARNSPSSLGPSIIGYVPAALLGTMLGLWFFRRMTDRHFAVAVNVLLVAAGAGMLL